MFKMAFVVFSLSCCMWQWQCQWLTVKVSSSRTNRKQNSCLVYTEDPSMYVKLIFHRLPKKGSKPVVSL